MDMQSYVNEIKLSLTGGVLDLELTDDNIMAIVNSALREMQRYICSTKLITIPYERCIDMSKYSVNAISHVFRGTAMGDTTSGDVDAIDPLQIGLWQLAANGGNMYNFNEYLQRYVSWSGLQQIGNTLSTDLDYYYEDADKKLYINTNMSVGESITIEYVPRYNNVEEVTSDYWIDVLMRLSKALSKTYLGRIRSRYTQTNALWAQDGETLLNEGTQELNELRAYLQANTQLIYPYD